MTASATTQPWRPAKEFVRLALTRCCQWAFQCSSSSYESQGGATLVIAPHQDDETLGCGALIARKRSQGSPVHVAFLTDGAGSHPRHGLIPPTGIMAIRYHGARRVLDLLGVDASAIHFLDEPDGTLAHLTAMRRASLIERIAALLHRLEPQEIFLPCRAEGSSEHEAAFGIVTAAIAQAASRVSVWEYPVWLWWNPRTQLRRLMFTRECCQADAGDFRPLKRRALAVYRSQLEPVPPDTEPALPRNFPRLVDTSAELFFRSRPVATTGSLSTPPIT